MTGLNTVEKTLEKEGMKLLTAKLHRDVSTDETRITLKSQVDWSEKFGDGDSFPYTVGGNRCAKVRAGIVLSQVQARFNASGHLFVPEGQPNITPLFARGIKEGVTLVLPHEPVSTDHLKKWAKTLMQAATELYINYLKSVDIMVEIDLKARGESDPINMED